MKTVVIKLGGSLVVPNEIDTVFLKNFKTLIDKYVKKGYNFGIVVGGGKLARKYQTAVKDLIGFDQKKEDLIGIETTKLNAYLVKTLFGNLADKNMIIDYSKPIKTKKPIIIGAGYKPDWSTDYDAVMLAKKLGAKELIELSNIEHVYDKDPNVYKDAKPYDKIDWITMLKICKGPWTPGLSSPLDPMAAKLGAKNRQKVVFLANLDNLKNYLDNKKFVGTVIE